MFSTLSAHAMKAPRYQPANSQRTVAAMRLRPYHRAQIIVERSAFKSPTLRRATPRRAGARRPDRRIGGTERDVPAGTSMTVVRDWVDRVGG